MDDKDRGRVPGFGTAPRIGTARVTLADAAYHAGDWDRALQLVEPFAADANQHIASWTLWIRGRILLARGTAPAAITPATRSAR